MVISIACSTRLEVFQCPEKKNIKEIEEKKRRRKPPNLNFPIYRPLKGKKFSGGSSTPNTPLGNLQHPPPHPTGELTASPRPTS